VDTNTVSQGQASYCRGAPALTTLEDGVESTPPGTEKIATSAAVTLLPAHTPLPPSRFGTRCLYCSQRRSDGEPHLSSSSTYECQSA
jgi:hypothetical protein